MLQNFTYDVIKKYANDHYDKIYDIESLSKEEADNLREELENVKIVVNNRVVERLILRRKLIKVLFFTILTTLSAQFLATNSLILMGIFLINAIGMVKNIREYKSLEKELENKYTEEIIKINTTVDNCERMIDKKLIKEDNLTEENNATLDLEYYANYMLERYLETGTIMQFLDPSFDLQVKMTLLAMLKDKYDIDISNGLKSSLENFREMEENGPKLTKKR